MRPQFTVLTTHGSLLAALALSACGSSSSKGPNRAGVEPSPLGDRKDKDVKENGAQSPLCGVLFDEDTSPSALKEFAESVVGSWHTFQCSAPPGGKFSTYSTDFTYATDAAGKPSLRQILRFNPCGGDRSESISGPTETKVPENTMGASFRTRISKPVDVDGIPFRIVEWSTEEKGSYRCHVTAFGKIFDPLLKDDVLYEGLVRSGFGGGSNRVDRETETARAFIERSRQRLLKSSQRPQWFQ